MSKKFSLFITFLVVWTSLLAIAHKPVLAQSGPPIEKIENLKAEQARHQVELDSFLANRSTTSSICPEVELSSRFMVGYSDDIRLNTGWAPPPQSVVLGTNKEQKPVACRETIPEGWGLTYIYGTDSFVNALADGEIAKWQLNQLNGTKRRIVANPVIGFRNDWEVYRLVFREATNAATSILGFQIFMDLNGDGALGLFGDQLIPRSQNSLTCVFKVGGPHSWEFCINPPFGGVLQLELEQNETYQLTHWYQDKNGDWWTGQTIITLDEGEMSGQVPYDIALHPWPEKEQQAHKIFFPIAKH